MATNQNLKPFVGTPYSYAFGRSVNSLKYLRIGDILTERAQTAKDKIAFISEYENISKTFSQLNEDVNKLSKGIYNLGLRRGDVVGVWGCNSYSWIQVQYSCAKLGLILCTISPVYRALELNYTLRKSQIKALFMPGDGSRQESVNQFQKVFNDAFKINEDLESGDILLKDVIFMDGKSPTNQSKYDFKFHSLESLQSNDGKVEESVVSAVSPDDPATIMFTSGTTGKQKGAYLSHFTIVNNSLLSAEAFDLTSEGVTLCVPLPFFHVFAFVIGNMSMTAAPFKEVIIDIKYDVKLIVDAMNKHECTHMIATPTQIIDILDYLERNNLQLKTLRSVLLAGAPIPVQIILKINRVIPSCVDIRIGYGATELGPCTTACRKTDSPEHRTNTVGTPLDLVEVKIVDPITGKITKIGEKGELLSRGHNVMLGYWRDQQKTNEAIDESKWYKSGDLAVMDENGFVKIIGRTKEMIIRGGENIYPREVEELLHTHPEVFDAYVVGVPDQRLGEEVCAWIQVKDKNTKLSPEDIRTFCKERISYFKVPRYVMFVDYIPMTSTRKAQKFKMREKSCEILGLKENKS